MSYIQIADPAHVVETEMSFLSGGQPLKGRLYRPVGTPKAVAVMNAATAVRQSFYRPFAEWLAGQGIACFTYDYRDFGASQRGPMRQARATMLDWGIHDAQAARDFVRTQLPGVPLWVIGHSLGGLLTSYQRDLHEIDRVIAVASGFVHVSEHPWPYQAIARFFWFGGGQLATRLTGYLPGKKLGFGPDLPARVFWQWRALCTKWHFAETPEWRVLPPENLTGLHAPIKLVAVADDVMVPPRAVWRLMERYQEAPKSQKTLQAGSYGLKTIGHIGVFDPANKACWDDIIN